MGIVAHGPFHKQHLTAAALELLDEQDLMDIVACEAIGCGDEDGVEGGEADLVTQLVQTRPIEMSPTHAVVAIDVLVIEHPALLGCVGAQAGQLLVDGLRLGLPTGRDPRVECNAHLQPPVVATQWSRSPTGPAGNTPGPSDAERGPGS
jgi:hypothetical protein